MLPLSKEQLSRILDYPCFFLDKEGRWNVAHYIPSLKVIQLSMVTMLSEINKNISDSELHGMNYYYIDLERDSLEGWVKHLLDKDWVSKELIDAVNTCYQMIEN